MKKIEIHMCELARICHFQSDKVFSDFLKFKGVDITKPFVQYTDFTKRFLIVEQEDN
jgi:hypothetical protein